MLSFFRSPFWLVTRVFTSAAILAASAAVTSARSSAGHAVASGSSASSHWVRWISASSSAAFLEPDAAAGALFTSRSRLCRTAAEASATSTAVSRMDFPLSLKKGRTSPAMPLTLSARSWVPPATWPEPVASSREPWFSLTMPSESFLLPALESLRPSARSLEPFLAFVMPPLRSSAPLAASAVLSCRSEKLMKMRSRKDREAFVEAALRTSPKTVREIWPTM